MYLAIAESLEGSAEENGFARGPWRQAAGRFGRRPLGVAALAILVLFAIVGLLAKTIAPYAPDDEFIQFLGRPQPPFSPHHLLGTDKISHDFLSQLLVSIHETLLSALVCVACTTVAGTIVGALAAYYGGWFDALVSWVTTVVVAVPAIAFLLIVIIWHSFPVSPIQFAYWLALVLWTGVARVVRASVASLRVREYVEAAVALGASDARILVRHLLPNAIGTVLVAATSVAGQSIVLVATVDYLGYGFNQYDRPTLGGLLAVAARGILVPGTFTPVESPWWLFVFPAVLLVLLLACINLLGDTLDDALNPRTL
jgi:ABC-type dipeptide/oligopeptide/nickel transport system permease subunit